MNHILHDIKNKVLYLTFNRIDKHNAFDDAFLTELQQHLEQAEHDPGIRVIVLKANGRHFSAGADLAWMQRMVQYNEAENLADATILARLMHTLYTSSKPTLAMVQGSAFGGGAGLIAACDIAIAAESARFCFSEVKLGLIPAVISPYVVQAIGARAASWLFMSAEPFDAQRAQALGLVHHCIPDNELEHRTNAYAQHLAELAPLAVCEAKALVRQVEKKPINEPLIHQTAALIAKKRVSVEGQRGLNAFILKETPTWD